VPKVKTKKILIIKTNNKMKTMYVVTSGSYSDYGIDAIFDTKELAQKFIDSFKGNSYNEFNGIEEFILNPNELDLKANRKPFSLRMDVKGNVTEIEQSSSAYGHKYGLEISFTYKKDYMNIKCYADDDIHAVKIANEKRTQILALNRWGENNPLLGGLF